jgi:hypothetical protein
VRHKVLIGVAGLAAVCWALWLGWNEVVFQRTNPKSFFYVIFRATYLIRSWAILSKKEEKKALKRGGHLLEVHTSNFFTGVGWNTLKCLEC